MFVFDVLDEDGLWCSC